MIIDAKITDKKLQYDTNKEIGKLAVLSSRKVVRYEYLTGEVILHFNQR